MSRSSRQVWNSWYIYRYGFNPYGADWEAASAHHRFRPWRPFPCPFCAMMFTNMKDVVRHWRTHKGDREARLRDEIGYVRETKLSLAPPAPAVRFAALRIRASPRNQDQHPECPTPMDIDAETTDGLTRPFLHLLERRLDVHGNQASQEGVSRR